MRAVVAKAKEKWRNQPSIDVVVQDKVDRFFLRIESDKSEDEYEVFSEDSYISLKGSSVKEEDDDAFSEETYPSKESGSSLSVGSTFKDIDTFRDALRGYAVANHFNCSYIHNEKRGVTVRCKNSECT